MAITRNILLAPLVLHYLVQTSICTNIFPLRLPPVNSPSACPTSPSPDSWSSQQLQVNRLLTEKYGEACLSKRQVVHLNMSEASSQCPGTWNLIASPVRGCLSGLRRTVCASVSFSTGGSYNHVCGRILGYQSGSTDGFDVSIYTNPTIEQVYLDGLSLTHGPSGSRQHIWSFISAISDTTNSPTQYNCPCSKSGPWPHEIPSFVGSSYFCDSGNEERWYATDGRVYADDPLWDGKGCGFTSTCCEFNNPPWFYTNLPATTSDDLELRICGDAQEDVVVSFIELYVSNN